MLIERRPYRPNARKLTQLFISGFLASLIAFLAAFLMALFNAPIIEPSKLFSAWLITEPRYESVGLAAYLFSGTILFPLLFDFLGVRGVLHHERRIKGAVFGAMLWLLAECVLKPLGGFGFFSNAMGNSLGNVLTSFIVWSIYARTLESFLRARITHALEIPSGRDRKAA